MKKHFVLTLLFAVAAIANTHSQTLTAPRTQVPEVTVEKIRQVAEQQFGVFSNRDNDYNHDNHDCDKCQKQKKSKKHDDCKGKGNHYGKHKNKHGQQACRCDCHENSCHSGNGRDDDRRYSSGRRDRDDEYRTPPQPSQRKPTSTAKVKTRPTPTAKSTSTRPGAKKVVAAKRPVGVKQ